MARALADESRAEIVTVLLDGRAWTAGELATHVGIAPSTASEHLHRLVGAGLLAEVRQGRHRYVRIASADVSEVIEALSAIAPRVHRAPSSLSAQRADEELRAGRTCYHHLAGPIGVSLARRWQEMGVITREWDLAERGRRWLASRDVTWDERSRAAAVRPCLDWTERREHAAGSVADAFTRIGLERQWFVRGSHPRSARLTASGRDLLAAHGVVLDERAEIA